MAEKLADIEARGLALVRIMAGGVVLYYGIQKLAPGFALSLPGTLASFAMNNPHAHYRAFLMDVAVPHAGLFAAIVLLGELLVGACLILGLATGLVGPIAALMFANYYLATGHLSDADAWGNLTMAGVTLVCGMCYAGCTWGVDGMLRRTMPLRALYPLGLAPWR